VHELGSGCQVVVWLKIKDLRQLNGHKSLVLYYPLFYYIATSSLNKSCRYISFISLYSSRVLCIQLNEFPLGSRLVQGSNIMLE
jgi:hypothetical protein